MPLIDSSYSTARCAPAEEKRAADIRHHRQEKAREQKQNPPYRAAAIEFPDEERGHQGRLQ
jgi:hypothetical protein